MGDASHDFQLREYLRSDLKRDEGLRRHPYQCSAGKVTIGYGRNLEDRGITEREATMLLENDINDALMELWHRSWWDGLGEVRQAVVANMVFNLGGTRFQKFRRMIAALERGDHHAAADEMLDSLWARQVGARATRLARQMRTGLR